MKADTDSTSAKKNRKKPHPARWIIYSFVAVIGAATLFYTLPFTHKDGKFMSVIDAFFTAVSAVCVTGLGVVSTSELTVFGQILTLILIQTGGLGTMTFMTLILGLLGKKISLRDRLRMQEAVSADIKDINSTVKRIALTAFIIEGIGAVALTLGFLTELSFGDALYAGIFQSISAFCNAGYDVVGGMGGYSGNAAVLLPTAVLVMIGGLGFPVISEVLRHKNLKKITPYSKLVLLVTAALILSGTAVLMIAEYNNPQTLGEYGFFKKLLCAFFQSVSTRSAGFEVVPQQLLTNTSRLVSLAFMFIGASPASTGGGIKTATVSVIILLAYAKFKNREEVLLFDRAVPQAQAQKAVTVFLFAIGVLMSLVFGVTVAEGIAGGRATLDAITYECMSAFSTVGFGIGVTDGLSGASKLMLAAGMFFGRLGPFTIGVAIAPPKTKKVNIKHAETKVIIG